MKSENMTILTVDDTPANIRLLTHYLEKQGYRVITAEDGFEGFKAAIQHHPDLVLLDIMMPGTDGYEVCELLKAEEETKDIPVVFLTAKTDVEDKVRGFELGAVDYITKPFNLIEIATRVQTQLDYKYLQDQIKRFYQVFLQSLDMTNAGAKVKLTEKRLNYIVDIGQKLLKKIGKNNGDKSTLGKEFEKILQVIEGAVDFLENGNSLKTDHESLSCQIDLNMLLEDVVDILQNRDEGKHLLNIHYNRLNASPIISGNLAQLQMGLLEFFVHGIDTRTKQCSVEIDLVEKQPPKSLLTKSHDGSYYCIEIASRDLKVKKEDLQDDLDGSETSMNQFNLSMMNLCQVIRMHQGIIDISSVETKGTKTSIYLPKL